MDSTRLLPDKKPVRNNQMPRKRGRKKDGLSVEEGKKALINQVAQGRSIKDALTVIDRTRNTYERWRKEDSVNDYFNENNNARGSYRGNGYEHRGRSSKAAGSKAGTSASLGGGGMVGSRAGAIGA